MAKATKETGSKSYKIKFTKKVHDSKTEKEYQRGEELETTEEHALYLLDHPSKICELVSIINK